MMVALVSGLIGVAQFMSKATSMLLPLAALAIGLGLSGLLSLTVGLILHSIARRSQELEYQLEMLAGEFRRAQAASAPEHGNGPEQK